MAAPFSEGTTVRKVMLVYSGEALQNIGQGVAVDAWSESSEVSEDFGSLTP